MGPLLSMPDHVLDTRDVGRRRTPFVPRVVTDEIEEALRARALAKPQLAIDASVAVEVTRVFIVTEDDSGWGDRVIVSVWDSLEGAEASVDTKWTDAREAGTSTKIRFSYKHNTYYEIYAFEVKRGMRS